MKGQHQSSIAKLAHELKGVPEKIARLRTILDELPRDVLNTIETLKTLGVEVNDNGLLGAIESAEKTLADIRAACGVLKQARSSTNSNWVSSFSAIPEDIVAEIGGVKFSRKGRNVQIHGVGEIPFDDAEGLHAAFVQAGCDAPSAIRRETVRYWIARRLAEALERQRQVA